MAPEIYLDVFIIDNYYEETNKNQSQKAQEHPVVKQRELREFC